MKLIIQRVKHASVSIDGMKTAKINGGLLIFLGIHESDGMEEAEFLARKTANLRVFSDEDGKMNKSLLELSLAALVVPNFTLYADAKKGNRPSYTSAGAPEMSKDLFIYFCAKLAENGIRSLEAGVFGADMQVELINDGPVTIILDTNEIMPKK